MGSGCLCLFNVHTSLEIFDPSGIYFVTERENLTELVGVGLWFAPWITAGGVP